MRQDGEEGYDEQRTGAERSGGFRRRSEPVEQPQDRDDPRGKHRPGEDAVDRPAVEHDPVDRQDERREDIDVGRVGAEQARRHAEARPALQPHLAEQSAGKRVGDVVQLLFHAKALRHEVIVAVDDTLHTVAKCLKIHKQPEGLLH